jgi:ArsR family transcriptional regulator, arsenate/arsenite/antimonite-responsive transcriptional repressor
MPTGPNGQSVAEVHVVTPDEHTDLVFKALASKPRRQILSLLATGAGEGDPRCCSAEEVCACILVEKLGIGAPTVSHHMKALIDAELVSAEKRGAWVYYRLRPDSIQRLTNELLALVGCSAGGVDG